MPDYLALLRDEISKTRHPDELTKLTKPAAVPLSSVLSVPQGGVFSKNEGPAAYAEALVDLRRACPAYVEPADWQQAREDGRAFLARWGQQAERLGWTPADLFGLAPVPDRPAATCRRLSRFDLTGLVWLLHGRAVVALTASTAAIRTSRLGALTYRRMKS